MIKTLITGATGNVGRAVIENLLQKEQVQICAGVRHIKKGQFPERVEQVLFDFEDPAAFATAIKDVDVLFLLRPPHLSNVKIFKPLIKVAATRKIHIVFLSVQGVEKSSVIPHHKIEKMIIESGLAYTFLRPSYFMQNLNTTLLKDIKEKNRIFIPAGKAKFNWIDVNDIGAAASEVINHIKNHQHKIYTITGSANIGFEAVAAMISEATGKKINYKSPNLINFFFTKKHQNVPVPMILVMIMLHFLPRYLKEPEISDDFKILTGENPGSLKAFINKNKSSY